MATGPILIVDDYAGARYLRSRILTEAGYEVIEASTGEECLRMVSALNPSLIVLDVNLPDVSGPEVCRQLKRDPATARIPVIQVTGAWLSEKARQEGLASGAQRYLVEPVDTATLLREVAAVLEESRQHELNG
jgi:CheY-like chemotaxis protein